MQAAAAGQFRSTVEGSCFYRGWIMSRWHSEGSSPEGESIPPEPFNNHYPSPYIHLLQHLATVWHVWHNRSSWTSNTLASAKGSECGTQNTNASSLTCRVGLMRASSGWMIPQRMVKSLHSDPSPAILPSAQTAWSTTFMCSEESSFTNMGTAPASTTALVWWDVPEAMLVRAHAASNCSLWLSEGRCKTRIYH